MDHHQQQRAPFLDSEKTVQDVFTWKMPLSIWYITFTGLFLGIYGIFSTDALYMIMGLVEIVGVVFCIAEHVPTMVLYLCYQIFNCSIHALALLGYLCFVSKPEETTAQLKEFGYSALQIESINDPNFIRLLLVSSVLYFSRTVATAFAIRLIYKKKVLERYARDNAF